MTIQELKPILITLLGESSRISWNEATDQAAAAIMELVDKEDESFLVWCFIHASWARRDGLTWKGDGKVITLLELKELYHEQSQPAKP